jgi:hypothetical protein
VRGLLGGCLRGEGVVAFAVGAVEFAFGVGAEALRGFEFAAGGAFDLGRLGEGVGELVDVGDLAEVGVDALGELGDGGGEVELGERALEAASVWAAS